jgi:hypothetical protein
VKDGTSQFQNFRDETWVPFVNVEIREHSKQSVHTHLPNKPKKDLKFVTMIYISTNITFLDIIQCLVFI